ncbi:hypothetical protein AAMO2058_000921700 [Amorphochlora amoebiformis]
MRVLALLLLSALLFAGSVDAKKAGSKTVHGGTKNEKLRKRERRDQRKMAAKKRRKELRRSERKRRIKEKVLQLKRDKKKSKANKIKPLNGKALQLAGSKVEYMRSKTKDSPDGIISMTGSAYKKYINDGPRGYYTLVVYTALDPQFQCTICTSMNKQLKKLTRATNLSETADPPVFFVNLDYTNANDIFNQLNFRHVPIAILVPPTNSTKRPSVPSFYHKLAQAYRLGSTGRLAAQDMANFIQRNTPIQDITIPQPMPKAYYYVGLLALAGIAIYLVVTGLIFGNVLKYRDYTTPYFVIVLGFYAWCAGAGMYNIIRSTPWHGGHGRDIQYFYPGSGSQYVYGSLIVGGTNLAIGLVLIILNTWALSDVEKKPPSTFRWVGRLLLSVVFNPWVVMALAAYIWWQFLGVYTANKNSSYNYGAIRDHELFDSEQFYKESVKWFKRTILGKFSVKNYRKGSRYLARFYRKVLRSRVNAATNYGSAMAYKFWNDTQPFIFEKIGDLQELVDTRILGVKDEL